jgi:hypothetical protein
MKRIVLLFLAVLPLLFSGCSKDDPAKEKDPVVVVPDPEPQPEPDPEPVSPDFISFKYNGTAYEIRGDGKCLFTSYEESHYVISCSDAIMKNAITLSVERILKKDNTYNIYNSSPPYLTSTIHILFSSGETIFDEGFTSDKIEKIGEISITDNTEERLSGTFFCKMTNGNITDGKFSVKEREYD